MEQAIQPRSWQPIFELGIPPIDKQHKNVTLHIERLQDLLEKQTNKAELLDCLVPLFEVMMAHFTYEETLLKQVDFPGVQEHSEEHWEYLQQAREFVNLIDSENYQCFGTVLNDLLCRWLEDHILTKDKAFVDYVSLESI